MEKRKIKLFLIGCVLFVIGSAWLLFFYYKAEKRNRIFVFPDSGFYSGEVTVEVNSLSGKESIYYTVDGKEPAEDWKNVMEYMGPITLPAEPEGRAYSFLFFCPSKDDTCLQCVECNYVVMEEGRKPDTDYVVCVQGDEDELFGYEEGIFVRGHLWDEYMKENPNVDILRTVIPANYFSDKEVEVHVAVFTGAGEEIISQDCGLKIYGNITRAKNQKSFRLISRFDYDSVNEFSYPFFKQLLSDNSGSCIQAYQRLSLHNAGNDNGYGFIRNTLCGELARQAGFPDVLVSCSAAVYINNRYMGVYWLQNTFDDRYFSEKYGYYPEGEMVVCEGGMNQLLVYEGQDLLEKESAEAYNDFCDWLREADVNNPVVWQRIMETIDVDNLLQYVAIEYYINNVDWPHNNVKVYRYQSENGEEYSEEGVFDGRYRYLLFDLDYGMGLKFLGLFGRDAYTEVLKDLCDPDQHAMVFAKIIERKECRDAFINTVINLGNGSFSKENVDRELDRLNASRWNELEYMMKQTDILKNSLWEPDDNSIETVAKELHSVRKFAEDRRARVLTEIMYMWGVEHYFRQKLKRKRK